ncbi:MAG: tetratricopeptide repeat protein [Bryobacteraceae bacterium]|jgi:tetratricopeptide (TPR) repeat protein
MPRCVLTLLLACAAPLYTQTAAPPQEPAQGQGELQRERPQPRRNDAVEAPPEEDSGLTVEKFSFNPLESERSVRIGNYYYKLGNYRAAAGRYREATQWNDGNSDAWLHWGEAAEKTKDTAIAKEAYAKYLKLEPNAKNAAAIKKRMAKLK